VAPHHQPPAQLRYRLTSRDRRDRKYPLFSLPLQASLPNMQLKRLKLLHKLSSNTTGGQQTSGKRQSSQSPPTASASNKNNFNRPHGKPPPIRRKRNLDLLGLPSLILRSLPAICSIRCTRRLVMVTVIPQNQTLSTLFR